MSGRGSRLTKLDVILLYSLYSGSHCCVDLIGVSSTQGGWKDAVSALPPVKKGKRFKYVTTCQSHGLDSILLGFSTFGSFDPAAKEVLSLICHRHCSHAHILEWEARCFSVSPLMLCVGLSSSLSFVSWQNVARNSFQSFEYFDTCDHHLSMGTMRWPLVVI